MAPEPRARAAERLDAYHKSMFDLWRTQEGVLQSYRGYLLTTQSLLLAVTLLFLRERSAFLVLAVVPIALGLWVLRRLRHLQFARGQDVAWVRREIILLEAGLGPRSSDGPFTAFMRWQDLPMAERERDLRDWPWRELRFEFDPVEAGPARKFFERRLPAILAALWVTLLGVWAFLLAVTPISVA